MAVDSIIYYWRPGCPFCMNLDRHLASLDLPLDRRNIWDDPSHATALRAIANGTETVPTIVIGDLALVNPRPAEVLDAVTARAPHLL